MVHRDIKPSNLMLTKDGNKPVIKVLDFGLAKVASERAVDGGLTHEGQMLGTPHYMAPEQTVNAQKADIRADIYSLGCTLYCLLTGFPPFDASSLYELLQAHHSMDAKPLNFIRPEVPVELAALVGKMMAKEPSKRFQTPREVAEALKPFFKPSASPLGSTAQVSRVNPQVSPTQTSGVGPTPAQPAAPVTTSATVRAEVVEDRGGGCGLGELDRYHGGRSGSRLGETETGGPEVGRPEARYCRWAGSATAVDVAGDCRGVVVRIDCTRGHRHYHQGEKRRDQDHGQRRPTLQGRDARRCRRVHPSKQKRPIQRWFRK